MRDRRRRQLSWQSPVPLALVSLTSSRLGEEARVRLSPASSEPVGHHVTVASDVDLQANKVAVAASVSWPLDISLLEAMLPRTIRAHSVFSPG